MSETGRAPRFVRFDIFEVDLRAGQLHKNSRKIKLQKRPFQVLAVLLEQPGEVVTREELRKRLWSPDTFVDFEHGMNTAIKKVRQALGDDAHRPRFVETLPQRGYRFVGTVEEIGEGSRPVELPPSARVGQVSMLCDDSGSSFVLVPADEESLKEKEKLEKASDDLGLALLIASKKILMVRRGTKVKVLEDNQLSYRVRILEGEHFGETALVLRKHLAGSS
jgi:DNA-binding winged helix-turn-helix (wHTH) protein